MLRSCTLSVLSRVCWRGGTGVNAAMLACMHFESLKQEKAVARMVFTRQTAIQAVQIPAYHPSSSLLYVFFTCLISSFRRLKADVRHRQR